jgi:hypothetical protein
MLDDVQESDDTAVRWRMSSEKFRNPSSESVFMKR